MEFTVQTVREARERIRDYVTETPLLRMEALDEYLGCQVYLKLENMQKIGAFKFRGAMNKIQTLTEEELARGIVAASSGNHGKALAYGAKAKGTKATIIMPRTAPQMKVDAIKALGAEVILCEAVERFEVAARVCEEKGSTMVPPYDDHDVMAGQGTLGLEIMEQCPDVDVVIVPASGGGLIGGVVSGVSTFVIGLIFSFYLLMQKEKLARQGRQVLYALLPERKADHALDILRLSSRTFSSFLSGQCLEAVILGTLFVIAMTIFRMPYALLVGVLIALTALIPIVGAFIGCAVGAILIAITDPWKALMFIVLFLVLQQIEGNLIYPHVVGSSVGLPSIWVLAAVTLGGNLMGIVGMLFFIPLCSVLYALFRGYVQKRLVEKKVPARKWKETPK